MFTYLEKREHKAFGEFHINGKDRIKQKELQVARNIMEEEKQVINHEETFCPCRSELCYKQHGPWIT